MRGDPRTHIPKSKGPRLGRYTVKVSVAPLRRAKSFTSGLDSQLLFGQYFDVYEQGSKWAWGRTVTPVKGSTKKGYVGYVPLSCLSEGALTPNYRVTALRAPLFTRPNIKSPIKNFLYLGARLKLKKSGVSFFELPSGDYLHAKHVEMLKASPKSLDYVEIAERHLGLPYVWGGISSEGLDCSGLVQSSLRAVGLDGPRDTDMQEAELGGYLPLRQSGLKRGDLIFWKGHVGIMTSGKLMIHANAHHMSVETEPLKEAIIRIKARGGGPVSAMKRFY